jgi:glucosyl-dolichyl phosphate glucuronosyltransferase
MGSEVAVSVIVPTRNREHWLDACLESLAAQDYAGWFEVIVVDNGSTDATPEILERWRRKDHRYRATRESRMGLSRAKNAGIRMARGDLLLFTDDDVIVDPGWIDAYVRFLASTTEVGPMVAGGKIVPTPDDLAEWPGWVNELALDDLGRLDYRREQPLLEAWEYVWGANMAVPARMIERVGLWDESLGRCGDTRGTFEDTELQDRVRAAGGSVWFVPGAVVHHRIARRGVTPCRVLMTTFTRGRNEYWQGKARSSTDHRRSYRPPTATSVVAFPGQLAAWLAWIVGFRLTYAGWMFRRAHRAAWCAGWMMESLRDGRASSFATRAIARLGFAGRSSALRLAPGSVAEAEETLGLRPVR